MPTRSLHLASASPRRRDLLRGLGLQFSVGSPDIDESPIAGESADAMVLRLAASKAQALAGAADVVLAADTTVVCDDRIFAKPQSQEEGLAMLARLSGRVHVVLTGVAVHADCGLQTVLSRSEVRFRDIDPAEALEYWQSGEPADKAGAYAIQGLGAVFVAELRGSYSGVVGLPVFETAGLLEAAGIAVLAGRGAR